PLHADTNWKLLEEGATILGQARSWVVACESNQLERLDGLLNNLRSVLTGAGLSEADFIRFESALETGERLGPQTASGSEVDCSDTGPREQVGEGMGKVTQAITK
ncbi:MAG: hypothetical protein R3245_12025, partial [Kiloniellales bacterium]|nr:hypothetical protein [Kiloniellales bacterium]